MAGKVEADSEPPAKRPVLAKALVAAQPVVLAKAVPKLTRDATLLLSLAAAAHHDSCMAAMKLPPMLAPAAAPAADRYSAATMSLPPMLAFKRSQRGG